MSDPVKSIEVFALTIKRDQPYLGSTAPGEQPNAKGYFIRSGNRTVYPTFDRSILVRVTTRSGVEGWGETYGLVAPGAVADIINDLLADFTIGRDPTDPSAIYDHNYDLMRVRGYTGGFYVDALAAVDIALWDIAGKIANQSVSALLSEDVKDTIPAYVSGLPESTLAKRTDLARHWQEKGFNAFKFATPMADEGPEAEITALRSALGTDAKIAADMHWTQQPEEALDIIRDMEPHGLWFAEAPVRTEDIAALETVCKFSSTPIAVGEEWRTDWDLLQRIGRCDIAIIQPEMGHTGITNFVRLAGLAEQHALEVIPHATIGSGLFLAASLQTSAALAAVSGHEFQHSIFEPNRRLVRGGMDCAEGRYTPPDGPGIGVTPSDEALSLLQPI